MSDYLVGQVPPRSRVEFVGDQPRVEDLNVDSDRRFGTMTPLEASDRRLAGAWSRRVRLERRSYFGSVPQGRSEAKIMELVCYNFDQ